MPNVDHLVSQPTHFTGTIKSAKPVRNGQSFVILDDTGVNFLGNRRRWVGWSADLTIPGEVRVGDKCSFLPGSPSKPGRMPKAHDIRIIRKTDKTTL
jgi:hypothetical protein